MRKLLLSLFLLQACAPGNPVRQIAQTSPVASARPADATSSSSASSASAQASAMGKYEQLLKTIPCPNDKRQYGDYADTGFYAAQRYCGVQAPAGFWVYAAPNWYVWKQEQAVPSTQPASGQPVAVTPRNSFNGKYKTLLQTINCPSKRSSDEKQYGTYADAGYFAAVNYCGKSVPAAYWVYSAPNWYLWGDKDLAAIGFEVISREVKLKSQTLTLRFEFQKANRDWAKTNLDYVAATLTDMEKRTGIAYPGVNPYTIEESPTLKLLGLAGPTGMKLISPPKGTPWTFLHEAVHIWNAGIKPTWMIEGHANYYSFLMMQDLKFPFIGDETYPAYIKEWRAIQGTAEDLPLDENYNQLPQGKAMAWWAMVHELYGPDFVKAIFVKLSEQRSLSISELETMLRSAAGKDPAPLLDGWIRKGSYRVNQSSDFGTVRFPLPSAWP